MKKLNPLITGIRLVFILTCTHALIVGIQSTISLGQIAGTYFMTAFLAFVSLLITHAPDIAGYKDSLMLPASFQVVLSVFTFCAMFLGEFLDFYERFTWWDTMLHFTSGIMFSFVGLMLLISLNRRKEIRNQLNPMVVVLFAVCFSIACGAVWEIFEFAGDSLLGMNMQKWQTNLSGEEWNALQNMTNLSNPGLINTMKDIIADTFGSLLSIVFILPMVKYGNKYQKADIRTEDLRTEWQSAYAAAFQSKRQTISVPAVFSASDSKVDRVDVA